jgi:hypothetical protein
VSVRKGLCSKADGQQSRQWDRIVEGRCSVRAVECIVGIYCSLGTCYISLYWLAFKYVFRCLFRFRIVRNRLIVLSSSTNGVLCFGKLSLTLTRGPSSPVCTRDLVLLDKETVSG